MNAEKKGILISLIIYELREQNKRMNKRCDLPSDQKAFEEGKIFFSLAFKSDEELTKIAKLINA